MSKFIGTRFSGENGDSGVIGEAEDSTYTDGLFVDFTPSTPIGTAIDRFNEVLGSLAPPPSPSLENMSFTQTGVSGKLSFGASNTIPTYTNHPTININGVYSNNIPVTRKGIFAATVKSGVLAENIVAHSYSYPDNSFGSGDSGILSLVVNGIVIHSTNLATFVSGNSLNSNGSGFNLSVATSVKFPNGIDFDIFKYRTGTWLVSIADQRNGYNYVQVVHSGSATNTEIYEWVNDADTTVTTISSPNLDNLSMIGSKYLSGIQYHTGGTAEYDLTIANAYRNTYSSSSSALNFSGINGSIPDQSIPNMSLHTDNITITNAIFTISADRILNESIIATCTVDRTVQGDVNAGSSDSISGILLDGVVEDSSDTNESFNGEGYRVHSGILLSNTNYGSGVNASDYDYDGTVSLVGSDNNYNDGLLLSNGMIQYPTRGANGGDYSSIINGYGLNPDYSGALGNRVYYRYFYSSSPKYNFRFNVTASSTSFVSVATGPSADNLTFEVLAPNTTQDGSSTIEFKDAVIAFTNNDNIGCYASSNGATIPTSWGMTLGSRDTSTSGNVIVIRITASSSWTGSISNIAITWL